MIKRLLVVVGLVLAVCAAGIFSAEVQNVGCTGGAAAESNPISTVYSISVEPCAAAPDGPCQVTRGQSVTFTMDWAPRKKPPARLRHIYAWKRSPVDLPLKGLNPRACKFTNCTLGAGVRRKYEAVIQLKRSLPPGSYPVKMKIYDRSTIYACQMVNIDLV